MSLFGWQRCCVRGRNRSGNRCPGRNLGELHPRAWHIRHSAPNLHLPWRKCLQTTCVLVGPHQLPTHFTLLGKSDGRMKTLLADVVLARAFGVGGVGNSVSSQFMASFRQRSGLLWKENANGVPAASTQICQNHWQTSRRRRRSTRLHQFARTSSDLSTPSA